MTTRKKAADLAAAAPALDLGAAGGDSTTAGGGGAAPALDLGAAGGDSTTAGGGGADALEAAADVERLIAHDDLAGGVALREYRPRPFVGAPVLYGEAAGRKFGGQDVTAAIVTQVHSDTEVNLYVLPNSHAEPVFVANVALDPRGEGEAAPRRFWRYPEPFERALAD